MKQKCKGGVGRLSAAGEGQLHCERTTLTQLPSVARTQGSTQGKPPEIRNLENLTGKTYYGKGSVQYYWGRRKMACKPPANRLQTVRHCPQKNQPSLSSTVAPPLLGNRHSDSCGPPTKENSGFLRPRKWAKMSWASACMHRKSIWCILSLFEPLASRISVRDREALLRRSMCTCARGAHLPTAQRDVLPTPSQHDLFRAVGSLA